MMTYLAKFMDHLSEMTEPLRSLEDKSVQFRCRNEHNQEVQDRGTCSPNLKFKMSTSKWKSGKCYENLQKTALEREGRQTRLVDFVFIVDKSFVRCRQLLTSVNRRLF